MTAEREHAEALLDHYKMIEAATDELAYELYHQLLAKVGWKDDIRKTLRTAQEIVRVDCERAIGATVDLGTYRSPFRSETGLKELAKELK